MTRFEVITGDYVAEAFCPEKLQEASDACMQTLFFNEIEFGDRPSDNFYKIAETQKAILDFLDQHEYPEKVKIVCSSPEHAKFYKVVYNFYFPATKDDRLNGEGWD